MTREMRLIGVLLILGAGWGLTVPLSKITVSTGRLPFGVLFWQFLIGVLVLTLVQSVRRRPLPLHREAVRVYLTIALLGTLLPNATALLSYRHLPAGIMSILISLAPMLTFPIALALGSDRFGWGRLGGLVLGLCGVVLLILPQGSLAAPGAGVWVLVGLVAPLMYALEANYVGHWGTKGLGAFQVMHGACWVGLVLALGLALASGQFFVPAFPPEAPDRALIGGAVVNVFAYSLYVWLVGRAGTTFAAQTGYLVTGFGVVWAMVLLGERYSAWAWAALALVLAGLTLVQPRPKPGLAVPLPQGENEAA
jgi:drug/metabolite transporter (DMT)-like permease